MGGRPILIPSRIFELALRATDRFAKIGSSRKNVGLRGYISQSIARGPSAGQKYTGITFLSDWISDTSIHGKQYKWMLGVSGGSILHTSWADCSSLPLLPCSSALLIKNDAFRWMEEGPFIFLHRGKGRKNCTQHTVWPKKCRKRGRGRAKKEGRCKEIGAIFSGQKSLFPFIS